MPSIYTHYNFSKDVYKNLNSNIKNKINHSINYYYMFSQSFDNFTYYNFLSLKPGYFTRKLGRYAHTHNINEYFINIIKEIQKNNLQNNNEVLCYLYGSINHYVLDSTTHPYINYISTPKHNKFKYKSYHTRNEVMIDAYYYQKNTNKEFKDFKLYKEILPKLKFPDVLINTMNHVYKKTFQAKNIGKKYEKSYNQSYYIYKILVYDKTGIKRILYKIFDYLTFFKKKKIQYYSFHVKNIDNSIFNLEKNVWYYPTDKRISKTETFFELYEEAVNKSIKLITTASKVINNKEDIKTFEKQIGNLSYSTGLKWYKKKKNEIFKY